MSAIKAIALYGFQSSASVELSLQKGDVVYIRNMDVGDGWCEGELDGQRGLFPISYVKMLEDKEMIDSPKHLVISPASSLPVSFTSLAPLTPQSNKKVFMETLLTPTPNTIDRVFDKEKAIELYAADHNDIKITSGPRWDHKPPSLTISVVDGQKQPRSSGMRHHKFYEVRTKELKMTVQRKYKHFLWLYDQLAERFPCVSLPPLPIKQGLPTETEEGFLEIRRRGLERFINRVARHPVLGSTKVLHVFLIATSDKEWRIGSKHTSLIKPSGSKSSKKLFNAPIYHTIHYPLYNVPVNQLAAFDKFSKFSETLENNLGTVARSCEVLKNSHGQIGKCFRNLGKDMQSLAKGTTSVSVRHLRKPSQGGAIVSLPNATTQTTPVTLIDKNDDDDDDEEDGELSVGDWNWRDDEKFSKLMSEVYNLGSKMRKLVTHHMQYQEKLEANTIEGLEEYSSIVHTLPVLVKLHEEAMASFNESKQKGSKKEAEHVRQDCETLNNILLAEFDYFSEVMIEDFQRIVLNLLKEQAEYHKKLACEWENMYASFSDGKPVRKATVKRRSTLPGSKPFNGHSEVSPRPASSDEKSEATYVNVVKNGISEDHLYRNIPTSASQDSTYENWTLGAKSCSSTPTNEAPVADLSYVSSKPIPPPLILRRHELSSNQSEEAELQKNNTDSFIVPNLHYSQVSVVGPLEEDSDTMKRSQSSVSTDTLTPTSPAHKKPLPPPKKNKPLYSNDKGALTTSDSDSFSESSGEIDKKEVVKIFESPNAKGGGDISVLDSIVEEKSNEVTMSSTYSPKMHTKLAKMTQLPQTSSIRKPHSKSVSKPSDNPPPKLTPSRTLPRNPPKEDDSSGSELFKKLNERRQKLERQLSGDVSNDDTDRDSTSSEGVLRWTNDSKDLELTKFGIIEEGSTFVV